MSTSQPEAQGMPEAAPPDPLFRDFAPPLRAPDALSRAISAACRRPEPECIAALLPAATLPEAQKGEIAATARRLVEALRTKPRASAVAELVQEYGLSSPEGVALMCLAEALLRIPDMATRDALIRAKIGHGDWQAHLGEGRSLFVNAATWGLILTGRLTSTVSEHGLSAALTRIIARCGEPVIRSAVDIAIGLMGNAFVMGETIAAALKRARAMEMRGFTYSYDMLGEAAVTAAGAQRYFSAYEHAIHAIGTASAGRGVLAGPGISIKLSALHPRYGRATADRVKRELLPRFLALARLAKRYDLGLNIDAEEADRLELSLDLLHLLCAEDSLAGWSGLGFVVQAYGKRCPFVLDDIIALARAGGRRIMVRLVKGAYWDAEIKRAQQDGLSDFPVFTRKAHTDVSYIACARKLLEARDAVFPQFATHNAQTVATIYQLAGPDFAPGSYEFQCLHGMGEPLYEEVVGPLRRPCRIYAPVGSHETLLAYLVRRLLENGANSSFVHRVGDPAVPVAELVADPADLARAEPVPGAPHPEIAAPARLYPGRRNSAGLDLAAEPVLEHLAASLPAYAAQRWIAVPPSGGNGPGHAVTNPGDRRDRVGTVWEAGADAVDAACKCAAAAATEWGGRPVSERAARLDAAADLMEQARDALLSLIVREAGRTLPDAVSEVREAVDFLRYYAAEARAKMTDAHRPLGVVAAISPWNFPLAIFTGQIAAALAAGNTVLAKPAEETPLIAAEAVRLLHAAGVPRDVLQLLPGDGKIGAALVATPEVQGVVFTGSVAAARSIARTLARRTAADGSPIPLIAETGGQNAMVVDSSALAEQVVGDVIASAFNSAGQRCSALRILCLQEEVAEPILRLLKGAMAELETGRTDRLSVDVGPVITAEAAAGIRAHVEAMRARGRPVFCISLHEGAEHGSFVAPTLIEIRDIAELKAEVFGPVLHVIRYRRAELDALIAALKATGYGLTFGLHTRLDEAVDAVTAKAGAGNIYVNRNMIGAVVGVQPFGGRGLSGTGPKAGGPLYLGRFVNGAPWPAPMPGGSPDPGALAFAGWLEANGHEPTAAALRALLAWLPSRCRISLPGPVGERNDYALTPRGTLLLAPRTTAGLLSQMALALASGNGFVMQADAASLLPENLPRNVLARMILPATGSAMPAIAAALVEGDADAVVSLALSLVERDGPLVPLHAVRSAADFACAPFLLEETSISINTAAAGGNASLMALA